MLYRRHLLPISVLALLSLLITLIPLYPNDLWWHMRSGEEIVQMGRIPTRDTYSFTGYGNEFIYSGWLSQSLLYLLYQAGGAVLLVLVRNLLLTAMYALVLLGAFKRSGSWITAAILTLISGLFSIEFWHVRPQIFGFLPFVVVLFVLFGFCDGWLRARWLALVPLATIIWTNTHGAFTIAPILVALVAGGTTLDTFLQRARGSARHSLLPLWATLLATAAAIIVNPWGFNIGRVLNMLLTDEAIKMFVVEWQPPHPGGLFRNLFYSSILLSIVAFARSRRRPSLAELLVFAALVWQSWTASRFIIWHGLAFPLLVAPAVAGLLPQQNKRRKAHEIGVLNILIALMLLALPLSLQPGSPLRSLLPNAYRSALIAEQSGEPVLINTTPVEAVEYLRSHPLPSNARLFNETGAGSYLIWAWRDGLVFVDPRYTTQPLQVWLDYRQISAGCGYNTLLQRYGITHALVDRQLQAGLATALDADPGWRKVWNDDVSSLYERTSAPSVEPPCRLQQLGQP